MPTIQQQLNQLKADKATLNTMLNTMGVETTGSETFTELAPLVGKIVTDPILQDKSITITENGTINIVADEGYDGLKNVKINVNVESASSNRLYLIKDGVEQTDVTGGSVFEVMNNGGGYGSAIQGDGYLGLCVAEAHWSFTFNNTFDYKTYSRLCVDWAYPKTDSYGGYVQPTIAIKMAEKPSDSSSIKVFLLENENTKERTVSELDVSTAEENIKVNIVVGNTGYGSDFTNYPAQIFNLYLEKN